MKTGLPGDCVVTVGVVKMLLSPGDYIQRCVMLGRFEGEDAVFAAGEEFVFRADVFTTPEFVFHMSFGLAGAGTVGLAKPVITGSQAASLCRGHHLKLSLVMPLAPREMARSWRDPFWLSHPQAWVRRAKARLESKIPALALMDSKCRRVASALKKWLFMHSEV
jgi:hypothetical protein